MKHELLTQRLRLRRTTSRDSVELLQIAPLRAGETIEDRAKRLADHASVSDRWFAEHGYGVWIIEERGSDFAMGFVGAKPNEDAREPELMYGLHERARGNGYAAEAAHALMRHLFSLPATASIWAQADPDNHASWRVMERIGLRFDFRGIFKGEDSVVYRLMREQYFRTGGELVEPTPWSLAEILTALELSASKTAEFFMSIPEAQFFTGDAQHWGPAYHLGHLTMTYASVTRGLRAGRRLPTHGTGKSRSTYEMGMIALNALAAAPPEKHLANPLVPTVDPSISAHAMAVQLIEANASMRTALETWTEEALDTRAMPHPYLGPITVREMLLFMPMHDGHHVSGVKKRLPA